MYHERFDFAVLALFTHDDLAHPFTVTAYGDNVWYVFQDNTPVGRITFRETIHMFVSDKVQFIPAVPR